MCERKNCGFCKYGHSSLLTGQGVVLKNGMTMKPNNLIKCDTNNLNYCLLYPKRKYVNNLGMRAWLKTGSKINNYTYL